MKHLLKLATTAVVTLLSVFAAANGGHAVCVSVGAESLTKNGSYYVHATSVRDYYTNYAQAGLFPVHVVTVLVVDGVGVDSSDVVASTDEHNPTIINIDWQYYVGPGAHHVEFYQEDYCEVQDDPIMFFYYNLYTP